MRGKGKKMGEIRKKKGVREKREEKGKGIKGGEKKNKGDRR